MRKTPNGESKTYDKFTQDLIVSKEKHGSYTAAVTPYKTDKKDAHNERISDSVGKAIMSLASQNEELWNLATAPVQVLNEYTAEKRKLSLSDTEELKRRTIIYLRSCKDTACVPSSSGLAVFLGYTGRALEQWRSKKPNSETGMWLEMFSDLCAEIVSQLALRNDINTIFSIFLCKAKYGFRETSEVVVTPNKGDLIDDEPEYSPDEIRARYLGVEAQKDGE